MEADSRSVELLIVSVATKTIIAFFLQQNVGPLKTSGAF
jgi:hypothetical protein